MAYLDDKLVDKVRLSPSNDIVEIISEHLSLQRKGKEFVGLCPFHQDKNPSFYVNPEKQIYKCFACGAGGDIFKFLQMRENITFAQALERLADRAGIEFVRSKKQKKVSHEGLEDVDPVLLARVNDWAMRFWQAQYGDEQNGKVARDYVLQRQINDEIAKNWGVGFASDSWDSLIVAANKAGISESLLVIAGLAVKREGKSGCYDKFRNRLMFPILDTSSRVIGFGGRTLGDDKAKYMNTPATVLFDKSNSLYGLQNARHAIVKLGKVIVVEGYTDVIMAHQHGVENVVAALGTSFTQGHARMLKRFASEIIMVLDSDVAGVAAANRAMEVCLVQNVDVKVASVPMGKDPCDFLLSSGSEAFTEIVDSAQDVLSYKWQKLKDNFDSTQSTVERKRATEEYLGTVAKALGSGFLDNISRGLIVRRISMLLGISADDVNKELEKIGARVSRGSVIASQNNRVVKVNLGQRYQDKAIQGVIEVLLNDPALYERVAGKIDFSRVESQELRQVGEFLFEMLENEPEFEVASLLSRVEQVEMSSLIVKLCHDGELKSNYLERLESLMSVIQEGRIEIELENAKRNISDDEALRSITRGLRGIQADRQNKSNLRKGVIF